MIQAENQQGRVSLAAHVVHERSPEAELWDALVLGVRDYIGKNGFPGVLLGLSGGIDSALVLAVAVDALGRDKVRTLMMPSPYTADISWIDARDMAHRLGVRYDEISIVPSSRLSGRRWPTSSRACRRTRPRRTSRRASAACSSWRCPTSSAASC